MILIPQPKRLTENGGSFNAYGSNIYIDAACPAEIFSFAKLLKQEMINNGCGFCEIKKTVKNPEKGIYLTVENGCGQNYEIGITDKYVRLCGNSGSGVFYAVMTFIQIIRQKRNILPQLTIEDEPDFLNRGFYLDVSRGRVPKLETLKRMADMLSFYKINQFHLYIEYTFAFEGIEEMYTGKSYLTAEEIIELDMYCKERYIELIPSISSAGHSFFLLETEKYKHLCAIKNYKRLACDWHERHEHHTIDVTNPESVDAITGMYEQILPLFSSDKFHICCDEAEDLCYGLNVDKGEAFAKYINKLYDYLHAHGKQVMMWGDMLERHPEMIRLMPEDMICMLWEYCEPARKDFTENQFNSGMRMYACSHTAANQTFIPQYWSDAAKDNYASYINIKGLTQTAYKKKLEGVLVTCWGDYGHTCNYEWIIPSVVYAGAMFWNTSGNEDINEFDSFVSKWEFDDSSGKAVELMKKISMVHTVSVGDVFKKYILESFGGKKMPQEPYVPCQVSNPDKKSREIRAGYEALNVYLRELAALDLGNKRAGILCGVEGQIILQAIELAQTEPVMPHGELAAKAERWLEHYSEVWRSECKEGELWEIVKFIKYFTKILYKVQYEGRA